MRIPITCTSSLRYYRVAEHRKEVENSSELEMTNIDLLNGFRVNVQVRDRLSASVEPSLQRVDLGRPTRLTCRVSGMPVTSVTWYKDGRPIPPLPRITTYDRTLHIGQVSLDLLVLSTFFFLFFYAFCFLIRTSTCQLRPLAVLLPLPTLFTFNVDHSK